MNEILGPNARLYASRHQLHIAEALGSGKDAIVLAAIRKNKPANVAINRRLLNVSSANIAFRD